MHTLTATNDEVLGRTTKGTANDELALFLATESAHDSCCVHIDKLDLAFS